MTDDAFWRAISRLDWRHEGDDLLVIEPVIRSLAFPEEAVAFERRLAEKLDAINGPAWAEASGAMIGEHVSADDFLDARCAVVANGREFYEAVVRQPQLMPSDAEFEALLWIAPMAYRRLTGMDLEAAGDV